ncbi:hypothetical protein ACFMQL_11550 [Nonomuraea fastidiosa]|jgi:isopentenyl phosphate kinase|uniref:amino acid kinase family protein n=1 Tax=Nonomuraea TaxID=83681 RepID=UPI0032566B85
MLVVKLGGAILTRRGGSRVLEHSWCDWLPELLGRHDGQLCLVHGLGTFGRAWMPLYDGPSATIGGERALLARTIQADLRSLHDQVVACLQPMGRTLRSFDPQSLFRCHAGDITDGWPGPIAASLAAGEVPVLYGGTVLDDDGTYSIVSSDAIVEFVAREMPAKQVIWLSDVPGVFVDGPDGTREVAPVLERAHLDRLSLIGDDDGDVTGGMRGKLRSAFRLLEHGVTSRIVSGRDVPAVRAALAGEPAGTFIG